MNRKVLGLPLYLWVGTIASATAILYFYQQRRRQKAADAAAAQNADPCDPNSDNFDPQLCQEGMQSDFTDSGDPCDPSSVNYDPVACESDAGLALSYGQSPGGYFGGYGSGANGAGQNLPPTTITIEAPPVSSGNTSGDTATPNNGAGTHHKTKKSQHKHNPTGGGHKKTGPNRAPSTFKGVTGTLKAKPKKKR